jgi:hypothetical protein
LPGLGDYLGPALLVHFGDDRQRFPTSASNSKFGIDFEKKNTKVSKNGGYGCTAVIVSEKPTAKNLWRRC